jgi:hypothetical protein
MLKIFITVLQALGFVGLVHLNITSLKQKRESRVDIFTQPIIFDDVKSILNTIHDYTKTLRVFLTKMLYFIRIELSVIGLHSV